MIFEITSSIVMGTVAGYAFLKSHGSPTNDGEKIKRIFENSNLMVREDGKKKTIRIYRKRKIEGGMEYIYQLPLGMSFKQIQEHKHLIEDGLNVKNALPMVHISELKHLDWSKNPFKQFIKMLNQKNKTKKEVDLEFDGMLKIKVYDESLPNKVPWSDEYLKKGWLIPLGKERQGIVYHDFDELPHLLIAGATGYGKSQFLKMLITALMMQKPEHVRFNLIDLKGGSAFQRFKDCEQVCGYAVDTKSTAELLPAIQQDMEQKIKWMVSNGFEDVMESKYPYRHFIVIDEAADLADDKASMEIITDIARRGRAAGYRLIYATQYPTTETIPSQVKRNIVSRLCFVLDTNTASRAVLDDGGAEELPDIPGRAIYKRLKKHVIQVPYMSNNLIKERVKPHINIKGRGEDEPKPPEEKTTNGGYIIEPR